MAFSTITSSQILGGKPTKQELFTKIKDNFDDHESRLGTLETEAIVNPPVEFYVKGDYFKFGAQTGVMYFIVPYDITLTASKLILLDTGSAGSLEVDIQKKTGAGAFGSIYSVKPILAFGSSQFAINSGTLSTTSLLAGDILRMDITQVMTNNSEFVLNLEY